MIRRSVLVILFLTLYPPISSTLAQTPENQLPPVPIIESAVSGPLGDKHQPPEETKQEQQDAIMMLGELRGNVRTFPDHPDDRLKLGEELYRIGDLDAAIDEYCIALKLKPDSAKGHLQLGVALMAKQDWHAALTALKEATRLDSKLTQAQYNLGTVFYTIGNLKAAIQSYQRALELQNHFPDARYRLALVLKLSHRDQESAQSMEEAAQGGVAQAQYFLGNAYRTGQGVEKNVGLAVYWWMKARAFGHQPAAASLSQLRRQALSSAQPVNKRQEALAAFRHYRDKLWDNFPDLTRNGESETLGTTLLNQNRGEEALSVLLQESDTLSEVAQSELARLYVTGWEPNLAPFDKRILTSFETTANEGFAPAKKFLALIYGKGLGMTPDLSKAKAQLKGLPKQDIKSILDELSVQP